MSHAYPYPVQIADATNAPAGVAYYPNAEGLPTNGATSLGISYAAENVTLTVEVSLDRTNWVDVTACCESVALAGLWGWGWLGGAIVVPAGPVVSDILQLLVMPGAAYIRLVADYPGGDSEVTSWVARGSL